MSVCAFVCLSSQILLFRLQWMSRAKPSAVDISEQFLSTLRQVLTHGMGALCFSPSHPRPPIPPLPLSLLCRSHEGEPELSSMTTRPPDIHRCLHYGATATILGISEKAPVIARDLFQMTSHNLLQIDTFWQNAIMACWP